jgi:hypothetical protein
MSLAPTFADGKKVSCTLVPLAHTDLKRLPAQHYLGRILHTFTPTPKKPDPRFVFGTPHGLLLLAGGAHINELTAEEYRALETLEADATTKEKILYGGEAGLREFITIETKRALKG